MNDHAHKVEFNDCRLGLMSGEPDFIIRPAADGDACAAVALRLELSVLDEGFARLLDPAGQLRYLLPGCFSTSGDLCLAALNGGAPRCFRVRLPAAGRYTDDPVLGRRFRLEFPLLERLEFSGR